MSGMPRHPVPAFSLIFWLASQLPAQAPTTAITGTNVVDVVRGEIHSGQTIIIANGRIEAAGPSGGVDIPAAAARIPGDGRYLMPRVCDMHMHLRSEQKAPSIR